MNQNLETLSEESVAEVNEFNAEEHEKEGESNSQQANEDQASEKDQNEESAVNGQVILLDLDTNEEEKFEKTTEEMEAFVDAENLREIRDDENFIDDDNFNPADYQGREIERIIRLDARIHTMTKRH